MLLFTENFTPANYPLYTYGYSYAYLILLPVARRLAIILKLMTTELPVSQQPLRTLALFNTTYQLSSKSQLLIITDRAQVLECYKNHGHNLCTKHNIVHTYIYIYIVVILCAFKLTTWIQKYCPKFSSVARLCTPTRILSFKVTVRISCLKKLSKYIVPQTIFPKAYRSRHANIECV